MRVEAGHIIEAKMVQKHPSRPICLIPGCDMPRIKTRLTCNGIKKTWKKKPSSQVPHQFLAEISCCLRCCHPHCHSIYSVHFYESDQKEAK